jgi:hypothetical protein
MFWMPDQVRHDQKITFKYRPSLYPAYWLIDNIQDILDRNNAHDIVDSKH